MSRPTISIRRYPNRRLYDRNRGSYVTLQDIEQMVREGQTVEVHDSKTGEELTRQILTQILLERYPERMDLFPVAMLHSLLQANDLVLDFWRGCLRQSLAALEGWQAQPSGMLVEAAPSPIINPLTWMSTLFPFASLPPSPSVPTSPPTPRGDDKPDSTSEPDILVRRVAELEARLAQVETKAVKPSPSSAVKSRRERGKGVAN